MSDMPQQEGDPGGPLWEGTLRRGPWATGLANTWHVWVGAAVVVLCLVARMWGMAVFFGVVVAVLVLLGPTAARVKVVVDEQGLRAQPPVGALLRLPAAEISRADVVHVLVEGAMVSSGREYGSGPRGRFTDPRFSLATATGPALRVTSRSGAERYLTVDDAQGAADALSSLIGHREP